MDNMLRDKIVLSTSDRALKKKMLRRKDLNLAQTIDLCADLQKLHARKSRQREHNQKRLLLMHYARSPAAFKITSINREALTQKPIKMTGQVKLSIELVTRNIINRSVLDVGITMEVIVETVQPVGSNAKSVQVLIILPECACPGDLTGKFTKLQLTSQTAVMMNFFWILLLNV